MSNTNHKLKIEAFQGQVIITADSIKWSPFINLTGSMGYDANPPGSLNHYILIYKRPYPDIPHMDICLYRNGKPVGLQTTSGGCVAGNVLLRSEKIKISLNQAQIDELIVYNRALSDLELDNLIKAYSRSLASSFEKSL